MKPNAKQQARPIIVKKIYAEAHGGHHGGAWKVAYADFVTAMMAFFLLMWLLGATNEKQRKALADYFAPTLVPSKQETAGSNSFFGGDSITSVDKYPARAGQTGTRAMTLPMDAKGGPKEGGGRTEDMARFQSMQHGMMDRLKRDPGLRKIASSVHFTETRDGLRIDLVDDADFAMFAIGTDQLTGPAAALLRTVGESIAPLPNGVTIRGHTDATPWTRDPSMNNWRLSSARSEMTRQMLAMQNVAPYRFVRIEGVADREPYDGKDRYSPHNRRISITLTWSDANPASGAS